MATQTALAVRDWAVEMCESPWTVEVSKNSLRIVDVMIHLFDFQMHVEPESRLETGGRFTVWLLQHVKRQQHETQVVQGMNAGEALLKSLHESLKFKFLNFTASAYDRGFGRHNMRKGRGRGTLP